jgi:hypothetical protein
MQEMQEFAFVGVPRSVAEMGANAIAFIKVLGLKQVDVLGFRSAVSAHTKSRYRLPTSFATLCWSAPGREAARMETGTPEGKQIFGATYENPDDLWLRVHFMPSQVSQAAGPHSLSSRHADPGLGWRQATGRKIGREAIRAQFALTRHRIPLSALLLSNAQGDVGTGRWRPLAISAYEDEFVREGGVGLFQTAERPGARTVGGTGQPPLIAGAMSIAAPALRGRRGSFMHCIAYRMLFELSYRILYPHSFSPMPRLLIF